MQVFDVVEWFIKYHKNSEGVNNRVYEIIYDALLEYTTSKPRVKKKK